MSNIANPAPRRIREPLTAAQLLMTVTICIFVLIYGTAMVTMGGGFLRFQQVLDILNDNAALIIISVGLSIVMIGGGINISVGGVISLTCMSCALFLNAGHSVLETLLLALGIGLAFGVVMGLLISYLEIQPFIVTLAGMFLARGLTTILSVEPVKVAHDGFNAVSQKIVIDALGYMNNKGKWISAKMEPGVLVALAVLILAYLMLRYTRFGRGIYALGGNRQSALMLGINVKRTIFFTYVLSGVLSGLAGFVFLMHKPAGNASVAVRSEMDAIAASIIGGTLLTGGVGNVIGTFFGVMILASIQKIVALSPLQESYWQDLATGAMLGLFIMLQSVVLGLRAKTARKSPTVPAESGQSTK